MYRKEKMDNYNKHIAEELLRRQMAFIHHTPQPTMFGGVRPRRFVLPYSTEYDYPSSLSVGRVSGRYPDKLDGSFWGDAMEGGMSARAFHKSLGKVGKVAVPIGKKLADKEGKKALDKFLSGSGSTSPEYDEDEEVSSSEEEEEEDMEGGMIIEGGAQCLEGGKKKYGVSRFVKDLGKISKAVGLKQFLKPIAQASTEKAVEKIRGGRKKYGVSRFVKDLGKISKAVGLKQFLKPIAQASTEKAVEKIQGAGRRGRPRVKPAVMSMEDLGMEGGKKKYGVSRFVKDLDKISKAVGAKQFLKPIAQALTSKAVEKIKGAGRRGRPRKIGGALLSGEDEGLTGAYPPQLSTVYKGAGAKGGKGARAEIVKKVMKEKGLSLPQASKYVKEHGLY
jgi:hypothetical protein